MGRSSWPEKALYALLPTFIRRTLGYDTGVVIIEMSNRTNKARKSTRNRRLIKQNGNQNNKVTILNEVGRFASDRLYCVLRYNDTELSRTGSGTHNVMNWRYRSSAFDPDPLLLTGSIPGFNELAVIYGFYRVEKMVANVEFNNQETQAVIAGGWPSNFDIGSNTLTAADLMELSSNVKGQTIMLGNTTGQSRGKMRIEADLAQLVGPNGFTDLDYSSGVSTNPVAVYYLNFGATNTLSNFFYAMPVKVQIDYHICFFRVKQLEL